ncbi:phage/plasmid primase, P4 family [Aliifodinibius sp. S!AR15-10]|uniref:phage/plasmid primase, P4 family n=1 Tax=Aliifodinibius sp. S!AR15-10 TaxID=2950437 RepID=UPI002856FF55|nr:phage/plasmid primase, P4 family [Aliifodinibius sp. S!AR15-10]MDR8394452.1 phage/plasmid primase, P4 family [Aliifodinibius sp. S!AR15-10]
MSSKLTTALDLAEKKFCIVPMHHPKEKGACSCGNDCGSIGKHPRIRGWPKKASRDPTQIRQWWRRWPDANIGIACGKDSNLVVLDMDPRHGGEQALDELEDKIGVFTQTTTVSTGGGGSHFYFRYPGEKQMKNSVGVLGEGLDIRTDGGLVVAPGSLHQSGNYYNWLIGLEEIEPFPQTLLNHLSEQKESSQADTPSTSLSSIDPIPEGKRNDTLFSLGVKLRKKGLEFQQIYQELLDINAKRCTPSLKNKEIKQVAKSASKPPRKDPLQSEIKEEEYGLWNTDFGNAREFVDKYGDKIRYDIDEEQWLYWNGTKWERDPTGLYVMGMAKRLVESLYERAQQIDDQERAKYKQKHARKSANEARLKAMMSLATTFPNIKVSKDQLDQHPLLVTLDNLTIDLQDWKKLKLNPNHLITKQLPFAFNSEATCPKWKKFISQIMDDNQEIIDFLQQAIGYSLTGLTSEQCLFFLYGSGRNGKSTFVEVLMHLLGEYSIKSGSEMIMNRSYGSGVPNDIARLCGHRLVVLSEIQEGKRLDEAKVKNLTGEDTISARFLRKEYFDFEPTHKLWVFGNHKPLINGTDEGIWRRMRHIKFDVTIPKDQVDPHLKSKLLGELPGIFNWAMKGFKKWQKNGKRLEVPDSIKKDTLSYRSEMDLLSKFLDEVCATKASASCSNKNLRKYYQQWCSEYGITPMSTRKMSPKLEQRGFKKYKSNGCVHWKGVAPSLT